jgi:hypothetical protein
MRRAVPLVVGVVAGALVVIAVALPRYGCPEGLGPDRELIPAAVPHTDAPAYLNLSSPPCSRAIGSWRAGRSGKQRGASAYREGYRELGVRLVRGRKLWVWCPANEEARGCTRVGIGHPLGGY